GRPCSPPTFFESSPSNWSFRNSRTALPFDPSLRGCASHQRLRGRFSPWPRGARLPERPRRKPTAVLSTSSGVPRGVTGAPPNSPQPHPCAPEPQAVEGGTPPHLVAAWPKSPPLGVAAGHCPERRPDLFAPGTTHALPRTAAALCHRASPAAARALFH